MHVIIHPANVELHDDEHNIVALGHFDVDGIPLEVGTRTSAIVLVIDEVRIPAALPETRLVP